MANVKYPKVWGLDEFFEGGSESPTFHRFLNDLPVKVENVVTQFQALTVEVLPSELRHVLNQFTNVLMEISHAGGMLSYLTAQNTKDTTALLLQGQLSTNVPFYNFPYTFGYRFSFNIYAKAKEQGTAFEEKYMALLRDTAIMTVEDLAMKHLGADITKRQFWEKGIKLCERC